MREESEKENDLKSTLNKLKPNENIRLDNNELKEIIQNIKLNWNTLNDEEKKMFMQIILKRVVVDRTGTPHSYKLSIREMQFN